MDTVEYLERRSDRCLPLDRWLVEDAEDAARAENEGYRLGRPGSPIALHERVLRVAGARHRPLRGDATVERPD